MGEKKKREVDVVGNACCIVNANHDVFEEEGDSTTTDAKKAHVVYPRK